MLGSLIVGRGFEQGPPVCGTPNRQGTNAMGKGDIRTRRGKIIPGHLWRAPTEEIEEAGRGRRPGATLGARRERDLRSRWEFR